MLNLVITLLAIALIAGILGFGGIAGTAVGIAKIVFVVALVLFVLSLIFGGFRGGFRRRLQLRYPSSSCPRGMPVDDFENDQPGSTPGPGEHGGAGTHFARAFGYRTIRNIEGRNESRICQRRRRQGGRPF